MANCSHILCFTLDSFCSVNFSAIALRLNPFEAERHHNLGQPPLVKSYLQVLYPSSSSSINRPGFHHVALHTALRAPDEFRLLPNSTLAKGKPVLPKYEVTYQVMWIISSARWKGHPTNTTAHNKITSTVREGIASYSVCMNYVHSNYRTKKMGGTACE